MRIYFTKWVEGVQIRPPFKMISLPSDIDWNNPPNIRVDVIGSTYTAYLDGQEILKGTDNTYTEGSAGVILYAGTQLSFSNFYVNSLNCAEND